MNLSLHKKRTALTLRPDDDTNEQKSLNACGKRKKISTQSLSSKKGRIEFILHGSSYPSLRQEQ
jgi:hypothetical protein